MAILEQEIIVKWQKRNKKHYELKGYKYTNFDDDLIVKVDDLRETSHIKLTKVCDNCGKHIPNQTYQRIIKYRYGGKDYCKKCAYIRTGKIKKENVKYEKSLEYYALNNNKQYLLKEFSNKNSKVPDEISKGTKDIYFWNCPDCKSEYDLSIDNRTSGNQGCPYCAGKRVNETNCLWNIHPDVAKLLKYPKRGYEITYGSNKKEEFVCPDCGYCNSKNVQQVVDQGYSCSRCSDGLSYPEKFTINMLEQLKIKFETQKTFEWSKKIYHLNPKYKNLSGNKKYDFHIPYLNMIIETHGNQHYNTNFDILGGRNQSEEQENDDLKMYLAYNNGIKKYIILDCRKSELEWIKNSILNSELAMIFNLSNIDWDKCHEYAITSLIKTASELWNSGIKSTPQIGKIINRHKKTVIDYLKKANELGWCDYNPIEVSKDVLSTNHKNSMRKIIQLSLDEEKLIKEWNSIADASRSVNKTSVGSISSVCRGERKTAGGYKWMYKDDYENIN